jgi:hypothetical protein
VGGHPDPARYESLVADLSAIERRAAFSELDPLNASFEALTEILRFLAADPRIIQAEAIRPLYRLLWALLDRSHGAKPNLFFDPPNRMGAKGAPSFTSAVILRVQINAAYLSLCEAGISKHDAAKWLAAELKKCGIKQPNGEVITAKLISRWDAERGGKSLTGSDEAFGMLIHGARLAFEQSGQDQPASEAPLAPKAGQNTARAFIKVLRFAGF